MLSIIQQILNKKFNRLAPFGTSELNGKETGVLYSRKGKIDCTFDFYYIKYGLVHYVNYYYYNNTYHRSRIKEVVNTTEKKASPREYLMIANYFGLSPDHDTFCDVVNEWMNYKSYLFYEDIISSELPESLPSGFDDIIGIIQANTVTWLNSEKHDKAGRVYADLYLINGKVCLITGIGKSDTCKVIADKCVAYDCVEFINGKFGLACKWVTDTDYLTVDYCIHMDSTNFDNIKEVNCYEYLQKAQNNIKYCGTSIPSFYHALKCSKCKMVILPFTDTIEKKSDMLKKYLCK